MQSLFGLFGESPFTALLAHGKKAAECVSLLSEAFAALKREDYAEVRQISNRVGTLETEADQIQNGLHELLTARVLLPVSKGEFFRVVEHQDSLADRAEDIANMLSCLTRPLPASLLQKINDYLTQVQENCLLWEGILSRIDLLVESSFSGRDALTVSKLVTELNEAEDGVKDRHTELVRSLFSAEEELSGSELIVWLRVIDYMADLSRNADNAAAGIRLMLKSK